MPPSPHAASPPSRLQAVAARWLHGLTPTCREVARLTSEERDHPLPLGTRLRLGLHRCFCQWCARYASQLDLLHKAGRELPAHTGEAGAPGLSGETRARMTRALRSRLRNEER